MTTVYVLLGVFDHEGDTLLGVYASNEAADVAYVQYCIDHSAFDDYRITPVEVGAAAEFRF
jgi:hypothetical protein